MKIISKFKDYYDGGAKYGVDVERKYIRKTEVLPISREKYNNHEFNIIGFCGKLYYFDHALDEAKIGTYKPEQVKYLTLYGNEREKYYFEEVNDELSQSGKKIIRVEKKTRKQNKYYRWITNTKKSQEINSDTFIKSLFVKYKTPIFRLQPKKYREENTIIINPCLKDLGFYKVIDSFYAFQQIEQFISNQLAQETQGDVPVGSDEVIGRSKGFNLYSFRNAKKRPKKF